MLVRLKSLRFAVLVLWCAAVVLFTSKPMAQAEEPSTRQTQVKATLPENQCSGYLYQQYVPYESATSHASNCLLNHDYFPRPISSDTSKLNGVGPVQFSTFRGEDNSDRKIVSDVAPKYRTLKSKEEYTPYDKQKTNQTAIRTTTHDPYWDTYYLDSAGKLRVRGEPENLSMKAKGLQSILLTKDSRHSSAARIKANQERMQKIAANRIAIANMEHDFITAFEPLAWQNVARTISRETYQIQSSIEMNLCGTPLYDDWINLRGKNRVAIQNGSDVLAKIRTNEIQTNIRAGSFGTRDTALMIADFLDRTGQSLQTSSKNLAKWAMQQ